MFELNSSSDKPLNEQIIEKTKLMIAKGILADGDAMPSVRELSKLLLVNQSTVQKAYNKLKEEGILVTKAGLGSFISIDKQKLEIEKNEVLKELYKILLRCRFYDIDFTKIKEIYDKCREEI